MKHQTERMQNMLHRECVVRSPVKLQILGRSSAAIMLPLALLCTLFAATGCHSKEKKPVTPQTVSVLKIEPRSVRISRDYVGRTDAFLSADIRSQVTGYITAFYFHEGERVHKGQLLFQISPLNFRSQVEASAAELERADADIEKAILALARAEDTVRRYAPLAPTNAIPRQQYADALAEAALRGAELDQMKASRHVAEANLRQAQIRLGYTTLRSPITGIAGLRHLSIGSLASENDTAPLVTISQSEPMRVTFSVSDADYLRYIAPEQHASSRGHGSDGPTQLQGPRAPNPAKDIRFELRLADGSTYDRKGQFYAVGRAADPDTDTLQIVLLYANPNNRLRPGQYVKVRANVELRKNVLLLPSGAVQQLQGSRLVWLLGPDNTVRQREIKAEQGVGNAYLVTSGLKPGDLVVVGGEQKLRPGDKVKPHFTSAEKLGESSSDVKIDQGDDEESASQEGSEGS